MDISLYSREKGSGAPLILLHGNGENSGYFKNQISFFSKSFRVIAVDIRGHGRSPRGSAPFTISQFAEDLRCFMDMAGIGRASILGFSDGANIAMTFALKYPEKVDRLILNSGNLYPSGLKLSVQIPIVIGYRLAALFSSGSEKARKNADLLRLMAKEPQINAAELSKIKARTLVIAGTRDMIKESHTRLIAESIPDSRLVFIKGDHFIAEKNPSEFNSAAAQFFNER